MNILIEPHRQVLIGLKEFQVDFILIGGYAVNLHGYNRVTGDMDVWLRPDNHNRTRFIEFLKAEGFDKVSLDRISKTDFTKHAAFHIGEKPLQVDFLTIISGLSFDEANRKKELLAYGQLSLPFLSLEHLIMSKLTSKRPKDKMDVEELQKIMRLKQK